MILKNYIYNALFQILRIALPVVTMPYVARVLSADGVGAYSLSAAWANYFMILGMIGIDIYGSRQIAYKRNNEEQLRITFWELNLLKTISAVFSILIYTIIIFVIIVPDNLILYIIQLLNLFSCVFDVSWFYTGTENFKSTSIRNIVVKVISTGAVFIFVNDKTDVWLYAFILCLGQFIGQLVLWKDIYVRLFPIYIPKVNSILSHFYKTIHLWIPSLAASIYNYLDKVMLGMFTNDYQVGIYDYSQNIVKIPATLIFAIATVTMPHVAADFANKNKENASNVFYKSMRIVTMLALPMCFGFMALSDNFVLWFLGEGYSEVGDLLKISAWVILPISWSQIIGNQQIIAKGREKIYSISICSGAIINVLLNIVFVRKFMACGVLLASIIAEIIVLIVMIYFSFHDYNLKKAFAGLTKYFFVSVAMYIVINIMTNLLHSSSFVITISQIVIGILSYGAILTLIKDEAVIYIYEQTLKGKLIKNN